MLNYIGIAILLFGASCGEFIYWRGLRSSDTSQDESLAQMADSKVYDRALETQVGTLGSLFVKWDHALAGLGRPGPLAVTIFIVSALAGGLCFVAASRMPRG